MRAGHQRLAVVLGQRGAGGGDARRARPGSAPGPGRRPASPRCPYVLAGRAVVDEAARRRRRPARAAPRPAAPRGWPTARASRPSASRSKRVGVARVGDRLGGLGRDQAGRGLGRRPARPRRPASPAATPRPRPRRGRPRGRTVALNRPSDVKEDGLALALQADVEAEHAVRPGRGDQRRPRGRVRDRARSTGSAALASASSGK